MDAGTDLLNGLDVLLVEDETAISFLIEDMLTELGATSVRHAGRMDAAMALSAERRPALALLDVNIAGSPVYPLAEQLESSGVPFVFITGYGRSGLDTRWNKVEVLQKPMTIEALEQSLRKILARNAGGARRS